MENQNYTLHTVLAVTQDEETKENVFSATLPIGPNGKEKTAQYPATGMNFSGSHEEIIKKLIRYAATILIHSELSDDFSKLEWQTVFSEKVKNLCEKF